MQKYANATQLAKILGLHPETVRRRKQVIEQEMELGRYNQYAIAGNLISVPVFLDCHKYFYLLTDNLLHDSAPAFNEKEAMRYL